MIQRIKCLLYGHQFNVKAWGENFKVNTNKFERVYLDLSCQRCGKQSRAECESLINCGTWIYICDVSGYDSTWPKSRER